MDNAGWHAHRRDADSVSFACNLSRPRTCPCSPDASKQADARYPPARGPDGRYQPVEQVFPLEENFVGGFRPVAPSPGPPPVPEKDDMGIPHSLRPQGKRIPSGYSYQTQSPVRDNEGRQPSAASVASYSTSQLAQMSAVERSQNLKVARMNPPLQFMCGPLLRYDTVDKEGVWNGAALIVTADAGSTYDPHPMLSYHWDPERPVLFKKTHSGGNPKSFDLGPHPADPMAALYSNNFSQTNGSPNPSTATEKREVPGQEIWVYAGNGGTFTFWRFIIQIPLSRHEMKIRYTVNNGQELEFFVPGRGQTMRLAAYSCNGFSAGVNADDFRSPGFASGYDPVWCDLLAKHAEQPYHALVGGGDQLYCDGLTREPELQEWVNHPNPEQKKTFALTQEILSAIDRFYFNHYCSIFRSGAFSRANSSMYVFTSSLTNVGRLLTPVYVFQTITTWSVFLSDTVLGNADTSQIDGFGSYPDDLQKAPIFRTIGSRGYFFFLLFQCFINDELDGIADSPGAHASKSLVIGAQGPYVPFPSHSFLSYLGPTSWMLMLDCRAERKLDQVCSPDEYRRVFQRLHDLPSITEHLIIQLGIPIAYPRMVFLETMLGSKLNPLVHLGRAGSMGLKGFVNKFNADAELLDDLVSHASEYLREIVLTSFRMITGRQNIISDISVEQSERNWFIEQLQLFAQHRRLRVTFLSGDVHCCSVGVLKTLTTKKARDVPASVDHRYMINIVTSAIVNTPPPGGVLKMVSTLATKTHRTMHYAETDETMMPIFDKEPDGGAAKSKYIMGRRNWCSIALDLSSGDMIFDIRVEKQKGYGETAGYIARAPAPRWTPQTNAS
ncbi:hypothetical protein EVG20_g3222 [Dentipellis fragilis]|uniref:PhoD-like phosphatase domain-containing protein n=1 Tax=Dentipellis fragilis TaxID=205917 RepID=A0A4Y9Z3R4_9AGAM|nr:hypothetical protein EVG20_g3222 [Dentipellis fragilis]